MRVICKYRKRCAKHGGKCSHEVEHEYNGSGNDDNCDSPCSQLDEEDCKCIPVKLKVKKTTSLREVIEHSIEELKS